ncbi:substrate-binding periplasmic protein [Thalassotalea ganghwensis]
MLARFCCTLLLVSFGLAANVKCQVEPNLLDKPIDIYTEIWPPFQTLSQTGVIEGVSSEQVKRVLNQANWPYRIQALPWARALHSVNQKPGSLIYSISRTKQRELSYYWIHLLASVKTKLVSLASRQDIHIEQLSDINGYTIALKREDAATTLFLELGFTPQTNIVFVNSVEQALLLIKSGRVDFYPAVDIALDRAVINAGLDRDLFKFVYELEDLSVDLYLAASKKSNEVWARELSELFSCFQEAT